MVDGPVYQAIVGEDHAAGSEVDHVVDGVEGDFEDETGRGSGAHADAVGNIAADASHLAAKQKVIQEKTAVVLGMAGREKGPNIRPADCLGEADPLRRHRHDFAVGLRQQPEYLAGTLPEFLWRHQMADSLWMADDLRAGELPQQRSGASGVIN